MPFKLFDFINDKGENELKYWTAKLQKPIRAKLNNRLDMLAMSGDVLIPTLLTGTSVPGILKLRIKGNVQLRPMLCKGPINVNDEYTLLFGAKEVGDELVPLNAPNIANNNKQQVVADPVNRRKKHERVN